MPSNEDSPLEAAARHVATGARIIGHQQEIVRLLQSSGRDAESAEAVLRAMLETQKIIEMDLERIKSDAVMPKTGH